MTEMETKGYNWVSDGDFYEIFENIVKQSIFSINDLLKLRKIISFEILKESKILKVHKFLVKNFGKLDLTIINFKYFSWPHQNRFQALMGHIFFPVQLEHFDEPSMIHRDHIQVLLALSSHYQNILAQVYLQKVLDVYNDDSCASHHSFDHYFGSGNASLLKTYKNKGAPNYFGGFLGERNSQQSKEYFEKGYIEDNIWLSGQKYVTIRGLTMTTINMINTYPGMGCEIRFAREYKDLGNIDEDRQMRECITAAKIGFAKGLYLAGKLYREKKDNENALKYFRLAAESHILKAYDEIAEIYLEQNWFNAAVEALIKKGDEGDQTGYVKAGTLKKDSDEKHAKRLYKKAGIYGRNYLEELSTPKQVKKLQKKYKNASNERFEFLTNLVSSAGIEIEENGWCAIESTDTGREDFIICSSRKKEEILNYISSHLRFQEDITPKLETQPDIYGYTRIEALDQLRKNGFINYTDTESNFMITIRKCPIV